MGTVLVYKHMDRETGGPRCYHHMGDQLRFGPHHTHLNHENEDLAAGQLTDRLPALFIVSRSVEQGKFSRGSGVPYATLSTIPEWCAITYFCTWEQKIAGYGLGKINVCFPKFNNMSRTVGGVSKKFGTFGSTRD